MLGREWLDVHHLTYDRVFEEPPEDLCVLCQRCHPRADRKREEDTAWDKGLSTYLEKKYGSDDWFPGCEDEFNAWLESKEGNWWDDEYEDDER
jgi:hypothetical protein